MRNAIANWLRAYANGKGRGYPDWAHRYVPIARWLRRGGLAGKRVLEVGANENGLVRFVDVPIVATDLHVDHLRSSLGTENVRAVCANIEALPFADGLFDVVVSVDTFEHLSPSARGVACGELLRVLDTGGRAAVAFPSGEHSARAEGRVNEQCKAFSGRPIAWLEEHREMGLPEAGEVVQGLEGHLRPGQKVTVGKNTNLVVWQWMWSVLMGGWPGFGNAVFQALLRFMTPVLCRVHLGRCYRTIVYVEPGKP